MLGRACHDPRGSRYEPDRTVRRRAGRQLACIRLTVCARRIAYSPGKAKTELSNGLSLESREPPRLGRAASRKLVKTLLSAGNNGYMQPSKP